MTDPKEPSTLEHLPIIDLSKPANGTSEELLRAAAEWGFLYIRFCGLPFSADDVNGLFEWSREFFSTPNSEKEQYKITPEDRGWSAPYHETLDENAEDDPGDFKEAFNIGEFKDHAPRQTLPPSLAARSEFLDEMQDKCRQLCLQLLEHFAAALEISPTAGGKHFFSSRHEQANGSTGSILRLLYYPTPHTSNQSHTPEQNQEPIRCGAHTDFGTLTLLFQRPGQAGLEIETEDPAHEEEAPNATKRWIPVLVSPPGTENDILPPVVVNIGDMLQFWTGGVLKSTKHRVVMPLPKSQISTQSSQAVGSDSGFESDSGSGDRYSIAYFCHPAADTRLVGVPSAIVEARVRAGNDAREHDEVITAGEHLRRKLDKAYGWDQT